MTTRMTNWLIRRPRNVAIVVAVFAAALVLAATLFNTPKATSSTVPTASPTPYDPVKETLAYVPEDPTSGATEPTHEDEQADPVALTTAMGFVSAWLDTDDPAWPDVEKFSSNTLLQAMATIDPRNIPEGEVEDAEAVVIGPSYHQVDVLIAEDTTVSVELTFLDRWRVVSILP